jgi:hypothetical protein
MPSIPEETAMRKCTPEFDAIVARLEKLERQDRWLKRGGVLVAVRAGVILLMGSQLQPQSKTMQGERFSLRDGSGNELAYLGMGQNGLALRFLD